MARFSRPVIISSTAADCPARPMSRRMAMVSRTTSMPGHPQRSAVGAQQRGHGADERGFPGAVGAEEGHHLSGWNGQVERVERLHLPESLAEALGLNEGVHGRAPFG